MSQQKKHIQALFNQAQEYLSQKDYHQAKKISQRMFEKQPENHFAHGILSICERRLGNPQKALNSINKAIELNPQESGYYSTQGNIYSDMGDLDKAIACFQKALNINPSFGLAYSNLAIALRKRNQLDRAETCIRKAISFGYRSIGVYNELALILHKLGRDDEAEQVCYQALEIDPNSVEAHKNLAVTAKWKGDTETAKFHLRKALEISPSYAEGYYVLSDMEPLDPEDPLFDTMQELTQREDISAKDKVYLHFALAASCDKGRRYDQAFSHYRHGNALRLECMNKRFSPSQHESLISKFIEIFDTSFFAPRKDWGLNSEIPVFILGMPRSGTTLVEQILSSHSQVHGAGELPQIEELARTLYSSWQSLSSDLSNVNQVQINRLALTYLEHIHSLDPKALRITDKMPFNFFFVWFIRLMFPYARIIHCRRNSLDTCLSCFMQNFAEEHPFSCDLEYLRHYYGQYELIMQHWREVLPQRMLEVQYEELVSAPEEHSRKIVEFCGLEWEEACLEFHKSKRRVNTASALQVRKGIYTTSQGRWRQYEKYLQEWAESFGEVGQGM